MLESICSRDEIRILMCTDPLGATSIGINVFPPNPSGTSTTDSVLQSSRGLNTSTIDIRVFEPIPPGYENLQYPHHAR